MSSRAMTLVAAAALGCALLLLYVGFARWQPGPPTTTTIAPTPTTKAVESPQELAQPFPGQVCVPHHGQICDGGDVWFTDSCGRKQERAERCEDTLCENGHCVPTAPGPPCQGLSENGRCKGNVLEFCEHGRARSVDCAATNRVCGLDPRRELNCVVPRPDGWVDHCRGPRAAVWNGDGMTVLRCREGGQCQADDKSGVICRRVIPADKLARDPCRGCACPSPAPPELPPIEVVAFLVTDENGHAAESEDRVRADFDRAAQIFAQPEHDTGIRLVLREVRTLSRPNWFAATEKSVHEADRDAELRPRERFFVPIVFVRELKLGEKGAAGVATLPAGACADRPPDRRIWADSGVIVAARLRNRTTVAHELGHYFGLCHTHEPDPVLPEVLVREDGTPIECGPCGRINDGVCDTPIDPGLDGEGCDFDGEKCSVTCTSGATPDPFNLMSYFTPCRRWFSDEQAAYMRRWARFRLDTRIALPR
jgi:hypothetical protein